MGAKDYEVWCQECGCIMKRRRGKYGEFWGCTGYPTCRQTKSLRDAALEEDVTGEELDYVRWDH